MYLNTDYSPDDRWKFTAGLGYSVFSVDLPATEKAPGANLDLDDLTWNLGVSYALSETVHLSSNLGRGFRAPNIFDLRTLGPRPGNRYNVANPDLGPEHILTLDPGAKVDTGDFQGELFGFVSDYKDKITSVATGEVTDDGRTIVRSENINSVELWGIEAGARYFARNDPELYATLGYTWGEEKPPDGGSQPADRTPPLNGRFGAIYFARPDLSIEPFVLFAAEQDRLSDRDIDDPRIDPDGTPDWVTLNLRMDWEIEPGLIARLNLDNITDEGYREHGSGIDAPGRAALLSITAEL